MMTSPEGDPVVAMLVGHVGDPAQGEKLLAPARKFGAPMADTIGPMSYVQLNSLLDDAVPYGGVQRYWKSSFLRQLGDDVLNIMIDKAEGMRSPMSMVGFFHVHGACTRIDRDATAYSSRADQWDYDVISQWNNPAETAGHIQWTRDYWNAVEPFASGEVYVNHLDAEESSRMTGAYSRNYERLVALKNKYDPTNLFHMNQNIKPTV
jgi:FAD/FMN-containing dehydrogenase